MVSVHLQSSLDFRCNNLVFQNAWDIAYSIIQAHLSSLIDMPLKESSIHYCESKKIHCPAIRSGAIVMGELTPRVLMSNLDRSSFGEVHIKTPSTDWPNWIKNARQHWLFTHDSEFLTLAYTAAASTVLQEELLRLERTFTHPEKRPARRTNVSLCKAYIYLADMQRWLGTGKGHIWKSKANALISQNKVSAPELMHEATRNLQTTAIGKQKLNQHLANIASSIVEEQNCTLEQAIYFIDYILTAVIGIRVSENSLHITPHHHYNIGLVELNNIKWLNWNIDIRTIKQTSKHPRNYHLIVNGNDRPQSLASNGYGYAQFEIPLRRDY